MANFNTHITSAAIVSGMLSTVILKLNLITPAEAVALTALGSLGGILPDIDLKYSYPSRIIFSLLGILASFTLIFALQKQFAIIELWMAATAVFLIIRFPIWMLFHEFSQHRGAIHSIATGVLFLLMTTVLSAEAFHQDAFISWLSGIFIFIGFIIHLLLDEIYSVDLANNTIKRSFGSALKIIDWRQWISSFIILGSCAILWLATPDTRSLKPFFEKETIEQLSQEIMPNGGWFGTTIKHH